MPSSRRGDNDGGTTRVAVGRRDDAPSDRRRPPGRTRVPDPPTASRALLSVERGPTGCQHGLPRRGSPVRQPLHLPARRQHRRRHQSRTPASQHRRRGTHRRRRPRHPRRRRGLPRVRVRPDQDDCDGRRRSQHQYRGRLRRVVARRRELVVFPHRPVVRPHPRLRSGVRRRLSGPPSHRTLPVRPRPLQRDVDRESPAHPRTDHLPKPALREPLLHSTRGVSLRRWRGFERATDAGAGVLADERPPQRR